MVHEVAEGRLENPLSHVPRQKTPQGSPAFGPCFGRVGQIQEPGCLDHDVRGMGYPAWFSFVIGASELGLGIVLLVPRFASYAAIGLIVIMFGALEAVLTTETALGWFDPVLHLVFLTIIGTVHWKRRWKWRRTNEVAREAASGW